MNNSTSTRKWFANNTGEGLGRSAFYCQLLLGNHAVWQVTVNHFHYMQNLRCWTHRIAAAMKWLKINLHNVCRLMGRNQITTEKEAVKTQNLEDLGTTLTVPDGARRNDIQSTRCSDSFSLGWKGLGEGDQKRFREVSRFGGRSFASTRKWL